MYAVKVSGTLKGPSITAEYLLNNCWITANFRYTQSGGTVTAGPIRTEDDSFDAPKWRNDDGGGHVAPRATWNVPRGTCHVAMLSQECSTNGKSNLSGQKRLGLNCVPLGESAARGQNCASRRQFFSALCPLSRTPLDLGRGKWGKADHRGKANHPPFCSYEKCRQLFEIAIRRALRRHTSDRNGRLIKLSLSAPDQKRWLFQFLF